jgi:hypothetical protein
LCGVCEGRITDGRRDPLPAGQKGADRVKYRKKQVEVEAIRFDSVDDLVAKGIAYRMPANPSGPNFSVQIWVEQSAAWCLIEPGDYVVRDVDHSGVYSCAAEMFDEMFDPVPTPVDDQREAG